MKILWMIIFTLSTASCGGGGQESAPITDTSQTEDKTDTNWGDNWGELKWK